MKVAIVYDRVNKWGGAERVLLALKKLFPEAPLYTSVYNKKKASWADAFIIKTSFIQNLPFAASHHELYAFLMPLAFESFSFDEYDIVISVTSEAAKGIITNPHTIHINICLTPTRYLWSGYPEYFPNKLVAFLATPCIAYLKLWDVIASQRPDYMISISEEVKNRVKRYYNRDTIVIYPPLTLGEESKKNKILPVLFSKEPAYFLIVSRLSRFTPHKKIEIVLKTAKKLSLPLKIIGEGNMSYLKQYTGPTIEFLGKVSDEKLIFYYQHAKALIFPGIEDFGLVMVEAQMYGKPVIAYRKGGALEIVKEGKTGIFFDKQTVPALSKVLQTFDETRYNTEDCKKNAQRFLFKTFKKELISFIAKVRASSN